MAEQVDVLLIFLGQAAFDARCLNMMKTWTGAGLKVGLMDVSPEPVASSAAGLVQHWRIPEALQGRFAVRYPVFLWKARRLLQDIRCRTAVASDVYSLPVAFASGAAAVVYDSREVYAGLVPEGGSRFRRSLLRGLEARYIRRCRRVFVTGRLDGEALENRYGTLPIQLIRNLPAERREPAPFEIRTRFGIGDSPLLLYQGVLNPGRGLDRALNVLKLLPDWHFVIAGGGVLSGPLKERASKELPGRVHFTGALPYESLLAVTPSADIGWVFIEPVSESYRLALPNKLFECMGAGVPVIATALPAIKPVVEATQCGVCLEPDAPDTEIAAALSGLFANRALYSQNALRHAADYTWQVQENELREAVVC